LSWLTDPDAATRHPWGVRAFMFGSFTLTGLLLFAIGRESSPWRDAPFLALSFGAGRTRLDRTHHQANRTRGPLHLATA
jgi:hypothetical protein